MSSSSDSDSDDYGLEDVYDPLTDEACDDPTTTASAATCPTPPSATNDNIDPDLEQEFNKVLQAGLFPVGKSQWLKATLCSSIKNYNDGDRVEQTHGSLLFLINGEAMINERGQVPRSIQKGDFFGHLDYLMHQPHEKIITVSRPDTKCASLSLNQIQTQLPLLPAMLLFHATRWFKDLNNNVRTFIARRLQPKTFNMNDHLVQQNQLGLGLFIIVRGTCSVLRTEEDQDEMKKITTLYPGHFVGIPSLVDPTDLTNAHVVADSEKVETVFFSHQEANVLLTKEPTFLEKLKIERQRQSAITTNRRSLLTLDLGNVPGTGGGGGGGAGGAGSGTSSVVTDGAADRNVDERTTSHPTGDSVHNESDSGNSTLPRSDSAKRMSAYNKTKSSQGLKIKHSTSVKRKSTFQASGKKIKFVNGYRVLHTLGQGAYGKVKLIEGQTGLKYAMKMIKRPQVLKDFHQTKQQKMHPVVKDAVLALQREVSLMKKMTHPNIVNLVEVIDDPSHHQLYIVSEFCPGGTVMTGINTSLPIDLAHKYFRDLIRGVVFMHSKGIVHRDIKPENLLLGEKGVLKICDFGCSEMVGFSGATNVTTNRGSGGLIQDVKGTPAFMAPELLLGTTTFDDVSPYACDIYSIGAVLFMFIEGRPPYWERNEIEMVERMRRGLPPSFSNKVRHLPNLHMLLLELLQQDPKQRIALKEVVTHQWTTMEGSAPVFETVQLMEEALLDQSIQCRQSLDMDAINSAFSISSIAFHVVVRSKNWLTRARKVIQIRRMLVSNVNEKEGDGTKRRRSLSPNTSPVGEMVELSTIQEGAQKDDDGTINSRHTPNHRYPTQNRQLGRKIMNLICCCKTNAYVVPDTTANATESTSRRRRSPPGSPPGSPSPQLIKMITPPESPEHPKDWAAFSSFSAEKVKADNVVEPNTSTAAYSVAYSSSSSDEDGDFELLSGQSALDTITVATPNTLHVPIPKQINSSILVHFEKYNNNYYGACSIQGMCFIHTTCYEDCRYMCNMFVSCCFFCLLFFFQATENTKKIDTVQWKTLFTTHNNTTRHRATRLLYECTGCTMAMVETKSRRCCPNECYH